MDSKTPGEIIQIDEHLVQSIPLRKNRSKSRYPCRVLHQEARYFCRSCRSKHAQTKKSSL